MVVSNLLFSPFLVKGIIAHRNKENPNFPIENSSHPFFHSVYIGIANNNSNKYGILYNDDIAIKRAREINPNVTVFSGEYNSIVKGLYFDLWKSDPIFIIKNYSMKVILLLEMFIIDGKFLICLLLLLFIGRKQEILQDEKKFFTGANLILVMPLFIGALPGILTFIAGKGGYYTLGYEGATVWFWILLLFYTIKLLEKRFFH